MKATDFTLAWMQKFDFDGHPYKFSKIDVDLNVDITTSLFDRYSNYSSAQKNNVMIILSDAILFKGSAAIGFIFNEGEIVYLSTLIASITNLSSSQLSFGYIRDNIYDSSSIDWNKTVTARRYQGIRLAGTFYIFDFNDNPV